MTTADSIADRVIDFLGRRTMLSTGTRMELRELVAQEFSSVAPRAQSALNFDGDKEGLEGQSKAILELLKSRRSAGAANHELAQLSLKYTSRLSDLRKAGYKISCERQEGRSFLYRLAPTDW